MEPAREILEGYVVDIACLRRYPRTRWLEKARSHTRTCVLEGHCLESGYGLVGEDGGIALLDAEATPKLIEVIKDSPRDQGIRARVVREQQDGNMVSTEVRETA